MNTPPSSPNPSLVDGQPVWNAIDFDVCCSRCGYNLRTLTTPRCPECGLEFTWEEALDWATEASSFPLEYRWRERPVRSFLATLWRAMRPGRFWNQGYTLRRPKPGPLLFLLAASSALFLLLFHGGCLLVGYLILTLLGPPPAVGPKGLGYFEADCLIYSGWYPLHGWKRFWPETVATAFVVWGALIVATVSISNALGSIRAGWGGAIRIVAYASVPMSVVSAGVALAYVVISVFITLAVWSGAYRVLILAMGLVLLLVVAGCLSGAYRTCLRLSSPRLLATCAALFAAVLHAGLAFILMG